MNNRTLLFLSALVFILIALPSLSTGAERFKDNGNGVVFDAKTNLMWFKDAGTNFSPIQIANTVISEINSGKRTNYGFNDWRIPRVEEILSLVDLDYAYPALAEGNSFVGIGLGPYWSSTGGFNMAGYSWVVDLNTGVKRFELTSYCNFFRLLPVRSAGQVQIEKFEPKIGIPVTQGEVAFLSMEGRTCNQGVAAVVPDKPERVSVTPVSPTEMVVRWEGKSENIQWFSVYERGKLIKSSPESAIAITGMVPDSTKCFTVTSFSSSGYESVHSQEVCATTLAAQANGTVWSSGLNSYGQLGNRSRGDSSVLVQALDIKGIKQLKAGVEHVAAIDEKGKIWMWGRNSRGQLGTGNTVNSSWPREVGGIENAKDVALGWYHSIVLLEDGTMKAWGRNYYGQLGNGRHDDNSTPVEVRIKDVKEVEAGWYHSMALKMDGTVMSWGWDLKGQLGNGSDGDRDVPTQIEGLENVKDIAGGMYHSLALKEDGTVWAWGSNEFMQVGIEGIKMMDLPVQVNGIDDVADIEAGMSFSIALKNDGTVWAWGRNEYGQLGNDEVTVTATPFMVPGLTGIKSIAAGAHHVIAVDSDGAFWKWGWNFAKKEKFSIPHKEGGLRGITQAAGGIHFTSVLKGN